MSSKPTEEAKNDINKLEICSQVYQTLYLKVSIKLAWEMFRPKKLRYVKWRPLKNIIIFI